MVISRNSVKFSNLSLVDDFGRIFFYKNRVFRLLKKEKIEYCKWLINSQLFEELQKANLIPKTMVSEFKFEDDDLILEHEKLLVSYKHEWTFSMLRDAALLILKVNKICNDFGYELKDAHFFNVLFKGTKPLWVDIGSIQERKEPNNWTAYNEFIQVALIPLYLLSRGEFFVASKLLESYYYGMMTIPSQSFEDSGIFSLFETHDNNTFSFALRSHNLFSTKKKIKSLYWLSKGTNTIINKITGRRTILFSYKENKVDPRQRLINLFPINDAKKYLENISVPHIHSQWEDYHKSYRKSRDLIGYRFKRLIEIIKSLTDVRTVIDLAGNEGFFSYLLWKEIYLQNLTIVDYDYNAIENCYKFFKEKNANNVSPLMFNFMYCPNNDSTPKRLSSDLVLALAVTHHLLLTAKFSIEAIFERLSKFTNKYVIVEFMPLGLWSSEINQVPSVPRWYNIEWFRLNFKKYFELIFEEQVEKNRVLFLGKKCCVEGKII